MGVPGSRGASEGAANTAAMARFLKNSPNFLKNNRKASGPKPALLPRARGAGSEPVGTTHVRLR